MARGRAPCCVPQRRLALEWKECTEQQLRLFSATFRVTGSQKELRPLPVPLYTAQGGMLPRRARCMGRHVRWGDRAFTAVPSAQQQPTLSGAHQNAPPAVQLRRAGSTFFASSRGAARASVVAASAIPRCGWEPPRRPWRCWVPAARLPPPLLQPRPSLCWSALQPSCWTRWPPRAASLRLQRHLRSLQRPWRCGRASPRASRPAAPTSCEGQVCGSAGGWVWRASSTVAAASPLLPPPTLRPCHTPQRA